MQQAITALARLFFSLGYLWEERETAPKVHYENVRVHTRLRILRFKVDQQLTMKR